MCPVLLGVHCNEERGGAYVLHIIVPKEAPSRWCIPKKKKQPDHSRGKKVKKNKELNRLLLQSVSCSLCHQSTWPPLFDGFFMVVWLSLWVLYTGSAVDLQPQHWKHTHRHQNIHYDTVKRYNNYTEKEITELKQHRQVFVSDRVLPRVLSSSTNMAGTSSSVNQALPPQDQEFHQLPAVGLGRYSSAF